MASLFNKDQVGAAILSLVCTAIGAVLGMAAYAYRVEVHNGFLQQAMNEYAEIRGIKERADELLGSLKRQDNKFDDIAKRLEQMDKETIRHVVAIRAYANNCKAEFAELVVKQRSSLNLSQRSIKNLGC